MKKLNLKNLTDKEKVNLVNSLCRHLKKGFSEYSYVQCDYKLIEKFAGELDEKNNNSFLSDKLNKASRLSFYYWEKLGIDLFNNNEVKKYFPVWVFYVKNRFQWGERTTHFAKDRKNLQNAEFTLINAKNEQN